MTPGYPVCVIETPPFNIQKKKKKIQEEGEESPKERDFDDLGGFI